MSDRAQIEQWVQVQDGNHFQIFLDKEKW
jgi:hypothetical protein